MSEIDSIRTKIFEIRGQSVILDRDLAMLYGVSTGNLNKAVKRNAGRFPEDFMFQITDSELETVNSLLFQNGIPKKRGGSRFLPYAFTEQGVAMISSVLNSETAIRINIAIMRTFVSVRKVVSEPKTDSFKVLEERIDRIENYIEDVIKDMNDINEDTRMHIELLNESLANLQVSSINKSKTRKKIGFNI